MDAICLQQQVHIWTMLFAASHSLTLSLCFVSLLHSQSFKTMKMMNINFSNANSILDLNKHEKKIILLGEN